MYLPIAEKKKQQLIAKYNIEKEIIALENVILNKPSIIETDQFYTINGHKFPIYKRSSSAIFSSNICLKDQLILFFIRCNDKVLFTDIKFEE
ncbi:hypothetical protein [Brachyspira hyodysenteriae]|uniref:OrfD n=1 Tax=Brachyspira hyodysenteriae TaxID=159 RepID=Q56AZ5_BRAHO|nr:hypothetical protein [Brachyspira hyodysenteriae]AAX81973.1 OrfD [Brachyspira hyodysenteriae]AUJ50037.1 hypothetical protein BH718_01601 [Brachyspira hyodysenteriae]KLI22183.1 hypothetical protein SU43_09170 [Brachyspira hyodysenteriae]KLI23791.1 hypothetical protein SR30_09090 [Brachyspira hyodysenteriae]KLI44606.1 hypothetical protein SZ53_03140 [Brachyspira hyodysenteriae]